MAKGGPVLHPANETLEEVKIMALEQCDRTSYPYVTDFYLILDSLINTTKDVDLLSDEGILTNCLGDSNAMTSMINNLNK